MAGIKVIAKIEGEVTIRLTHVEGKFVSKDEILDILTEHLDDLFTVAQDEIEMADVSGIGDDMMSIYELEVDAGLEVVLS